MSQKTIQLSFFIALTLFLLVLSFLVFKPYLGIIFLSGVLAIAFYPLYLRFLSWFKGNNGLAAGLTLAVITFAIVIPAILVSASVIKEAIGLYNSLAFGGGAEQALLYLDQTSSKIGATLLNDPGFSINFDEHIRNILNWVIGHFDSVFAVVFNGIFGFILMLISIYYLLKSGSYINENIKIWSPLPDDYDEEVIAALHASVDAVIKGRFLVSVAQGFFISLGFMIFGVGNPVLWGFVGGIASLIPTLGTAVITVPASIYLIATGSTGAGVGMLIWGAFAVGLIDNVLSVVLLKRKIHINPLIILFSILGGVEFFGPVGFIAGPVLVSAFLSLIRIYPFIMSYREDVF